MAARGSARLRHAVLQPASRVGTCCVLRGVPCVAGLPGDDADAADPWQGVQPVSFLASACCRESGCACVWPLLAGMRCPSWGVKEAWVIRGAGARPCTFQPFYTFALRGA